MSSFPELTDTQKIANYETFRHIEAVRDNIGIVITELLRRAALHDQSKLVPPEVDGFASANNRLAGLTYGSEAYDANRQQADLKAALVHHYARNRHHPEHHKDGVDDMNLVDLIELFCDWRASSQRHNDGNLNKSIEHNANRFRLSPQLVKILENSVGLFE